MPEQAASRDSGMNQKQEAEHSAAWPRPSPSQSFAYRHTLLFCSFCPLQAEWEIPVTHWQTDSGLQLKHQTQLQLLHIPNLLQLWTHKEILWQVTHFIYCTSFKSTRPNLIIKAWKQRGTFTACLLLLPEMHVSLCCDEI